MPVRSAPGGWRAAIRGAVVPSRRRTGAVRLPAALLTVVAAVLVAVALTHVGNQSTLFVWYDVLIYGLFAVSTNVVVGWNGVGTFGQALYFAAGAYVTALLRDHNVPGELLLLLGLLLGATLGLAFGLIATRAGSLGAMAMLTLMSSMLAYQILYGVDALGGENGIVGIPRGTIFGVDLNQPRIFDAYIVAVVAVCCYCLIRLRRSTLVHSMLAARDDPTRARAAGLPVKLLRITGFVIGGLFGAIAGVLYSQTQGVIGPDIAYWTTSGTVLMMVIIGGTGHIWGPFLGAALYEWVNQELLGTTSRMNIYLGLALLAFLIFAPRGVSQLIVDCGRLALRLVRRLGRRPRPPNTPVPAQERAAGAALVGDPLGRRSG